MLGGPLLKPQRHLWLAPRRTCDTAFPSDDDARVGDHSLVRGRTSPDSGTTSTGLTSPRFSSSRLISAAACKGSAIGSGSPSFSPSAPLMMPASAEVPASHANPTKHTLRTVRLCSILGAPVFSIDHIALRISQMGRQRRMGVRGHGFALLSFFTSDFGSSPRRIIDLGSFRW